MDPHQKPADPIALSREFDSLARALWRAVAGVDEGDASRQPGAGEWSVQQILAHLLGPAPHGYVGDVRRVLQGEQPRVALDPGMAQYSEARLFLRTSRLASLVVHEYQRLAHLCVALSQPELTRRVRVEEMTQVDGEHPTLAAYLDALLAHLATHVRQIEETHRRVADDCLGRARRPTVPSPTRERDVSRSKVA